MKHFCLTETCELGPLKEKLIFKSFCSVFAPSKLNPIQLSFDGKFFSLSVSKEFILSDP